MQSDRFKSWSTVLAGALGCAVGAGVVANFVFGIFVKEIAAEYGWTRSAATLSISVFLVFSGLGSLSLGAIMSRWPIRPVTMLFVAIFSSALALVAALPNSLLLLCLTFAVIGFFGSAATPMPYAIAIAGWFDRRRGLALALAVSGTAVSGAFMASYTNWLMQNYGWRGGYVGIALLVGGVALFALAFLFHTPPARKAAVSEDTAQTSLRDLLFNDRTFWLFGLPIFFISVAGGGVITNLAPILTDRGSTMAEASVILGVLGGSTIISRLMIGVLLDYLHVRIVAAAVFALLVAGLLLVAGDFGRPLTIAAVIMIGMAMGGEADLVTFGASRYYPPDALPRALGGIWICWAWGGGAGVALASASFDLLGSYAPAIYLFAGLSLAATVTVTRLGPYRFAAAHAPEAVPAAA